MENRMYALQGEGEFKFTCMGGYLRKYLEGPEPPVIQFLGGSEGLYIAGIKPY